MSKPPMAVATLLLAVVTGVSMVALASGHSRRSTEPAVDWSRATISSGAATIAYPSSWQALRGDKGTVSFALRDAGGRYLGYLNVTPRQGSEQLAGWAQFRAHRNSEEGDKDVRVLESAEGVTFPGARGSCVSDEYLSRVGSHSYRELACIVSGRRSTSVFIGATLASEWSRLGQIIRHSAATLIER